MNVTITISHEGEDVLVNVRSRSRIGKGDLGANARRIRRFQAELAKRMSGKMSQARLTAVSLTPALQRTVPRFATPRR